MARRRGSSKADVPRRRRQYQEPIPTQLSELIPVMLKHMGLKGGQQAELRRAWELVAGEEFAAVTRIKGFRKGILTIEVSNAATQQELQVYLKKEIIRALRERLSKPLQDVRFRLQSGTAKPLYEERRKPTEDELFPKGNE